ncbi:exodeoxyribonuclease VII large subunit [Fluviicola taffensis]|uniref:Exodeoxyribonuclease 7 large subunit n=1 Tax=Fluviicola taffensis (strain DSM 16823 / NCIMB 13979 / RW262) TaxID=755732 RepID=F2IF40_FLUTR|nr:exodeoxyribonuclease VII large subunit [Fluviicola taffensis]AEA43514.1 Exonuclease VII, large subunit [Fluviicola taffensis DSM 16823]
MQTPEYFTLKQVADSIRKVIAERYSRTYWVIAEMHKLNSTKKGHCYPELVQKEDGLIVVEMRGTIWKQNFERIQQKFYEIVKEPLRDGMELLFQVKITYHPIYNIGLEIIDIDPNYALGALQRERQETLERLNKEGILNANQQIEMALVPKRLAIISQADSKGYSDFVTLLNGHPKRYHFNTFLFEAALQGDNAIASIKGQLKRIEEIKHHFDAVVIIRGGGGEVGMHCYNNYELAKAIATFPLPVLTGIGHSTNLTVCEMIAFRNGITPSDMAYFLLSIFEELDAPLDEALMKLPKQIQHLLQESKNQFGQLTLTFKQEVQAVLLSEKNAFHGIVKDFEFQVKHKMTYSNQVLTQLRNQIRSSSGYFFESQKNKRENLINLLQIHSKSILNSSLQTINNQQNQLIRFFPRRFETETKNLEQAELHLNLLDPITILQRGYAIVTNQKGVLSAKNQAKAGEELKIVTEAQELNAKVK